MMKLIQDHEHKINQNSFSLRTLQNTLEAKGFDRKGNPLGLEDAKKYMLRYMFPVEGGIMLNSNGKVEFKSMDIMNKTYFGRMDDVLKKWFKSQTYDIYRRVCSPGRQLIMGDTINVVGAFKHTIDLKYDECEEQEKKGVEMMFDFIKTVWCSGDDEQYEYIINWLASMCQGNKNEMLLYAKSHTEGIGKSTLTEFLMDHVIGRNLSIQPSSNVLTSGNNNCLFGKLFVCFEELKSSKAEWTKMSSCLKEWITSDTIAFSEKYMVGFTGANINNYIINTNTEAVRGAGGRRYFICELSTKYKGDHDYWNNLYSTCFNDDVGKAFYLYMTERDIKNFKSNKPPTTKKKKEYISELLSSTYKFLKFNYLLCGKDIKKISVMELYKQYSIYCDNKDVYKHTKMKFNGQIKELGFNYKTSNSKSLWNITNDELKEVATKHSWYSELDNDEIAEHVIWEDYKTVKEVAQPNNYFDLQNTINEKEKIIDEQAKEIEELKKQLALLSKPKKKSKSKKKKKDKSKKKKKVVKRKSVGKIVIDETNSALDAFLNM